MSLSNQSLHSIADVLDKAEKEAKPILPITDQDPRFDLEDAYSVQTMNAARAMKEGKRLTGYKIGLTSREAQKHFGLSHPDYGHLFHTMAVPEEGEIDLSGLIQPKIEGEVAFVLGKDLKGPGLTLVNALNAVDYALVAMEIVDSRIENWKIKAADTIADNGSSARYVLGSVKRSLKDCDLATIGMALSKNGEVLVTGAGAAVMGNPLNALVFLANELGKRDRALLAGEVVLSGSLSGMLGIQPRDSFTCEMLGLGKCSVHFTRKGAL